MDEPLTKTRKTWNNNHGLHTIPYYTVLYCTIVLYILVDSTPTCTRIIVLSNQFEEKSTNAPLA